jgi:hypothetical protein
MHIAHPPGRRLRRWSTAVVAAGAVLLGSGAVVLGVAAPAQAAYAANARVDLKVLVVTDGRSNVEAVTAQMDREGVPYQVVDLRLTNRPTINAAYLSDTVSGQPRAKFQAVVLADESALPAAEMTALATYEAQFGIRQLTAYTWAHAGVGLAPAVWAGTVDGMTATASAAAKAAGFGYLNGPVPLDDVDASVPESFAALANGAPATGQTYTPYLTLPVPGQGGATASVLGVYAHDGRQEMVTTISLNQFQTHSRMLAHGVVEWLTQGVHLGHWRNWFSVHVDDVFLPDDRWHMQGNCTVGDDCGPQYTNTPIRMIPADVTTLVAWQNANGMKLDMVYNGDGSAEAGANDPLTGSLVSNRAALRWINHTYTHAYLGCVQDFTVIPWRCATTATGAVQFIPRATIESEIQQNLTFAQQKGISVDPTELVTGQHSGLKSLPQMTVDNPNLAPALNARGVRTIASDNSRESTSRLVGSGPARTQPRHPMNIYYNTGTRAEAVDEYNWIYTSQADGGSGICTANPATSTCIAPLPVPGGFDSYIVPIEARIALSHVVANDPRPHYAHQSNITEDRILYPVLDEVLRRYRTAYATNTPVVNPKLSASAEQMRRADAWQAALANGQIQAYLSNGRVTIINGTSSALHVPASAPNGTNVVTLSLLGIELLSGPYGQAYGGGKSDWTQLAAGGRLVLRLP